MYSVATRIRRLCAGGAEAGEDVVEIGHGVDVDPGLRHSDHDIGAAEAENCRSRSTRLSASAMVQLWRSSP